MTLDDLVDQCWDEIRVFRKRAVGKDGVKKILMDSLQEWDTDLLMKCRDDNDYRQYKEWLHQRVRARNMAENEYGFALLAFLLMTVASAVISWLIQWWLNHLTDRDSFEEVRRRLRG